MTEQSFTLRGRADGRLAIQDRDGRLVAREGEGYRDQLMYLPVDAAMVCTFTPAEAHAFMRGYRLAQQEEELNR